MYNRVLTAMIACGAALSLASPLANAGASKSRNTSVGTTSTSTSTDYTLSGTVSGEAFGAAVALLGLVGVKIGPIPHVTLPSSGGFDAETLLGVAVPNILGAETLPVLTVGAVGPRVAGSASVAAVEKVNLLNGLITADLVLGVCSSGANGLVATSNAQGSTLANLAIGGRAITAAPAPNTRIPLLDGFLRIGEVILNEQIYGGDGVRTAAVDVNMLHVKLADGGVLLNGQLLKGDIIVSSAHCDVNASRTTGTGGNDGFITGGGVLDSGDAAASFGFNARPGSGELQYMDYGTGLNLHGTTVTSFSVSGHCAEFSGAAKKDNVDGYAYEVQACDNGEPGVDADTFSITATGPDGFHYTRSGTLAGGNVQLH